MYHSIGEAPAEEIGAGRYCVSVENFRKQVEYIELVSSLARKLVLVTFDDGLVDNYTNAWPILKEKGLKAHFFIIVSKIGVPGYMNWEQIRELKDGGMIIGSHGMTHRILTELKDKDLDDELVESKKILEDKLGQAVDYLSLPRGFYDKRVIEMAKKSGYKAVFTSNPKDNDGFKCGRIPVKADWGNEYFKKVLNSGYSFSDSAKEYLKTISKKLLGAKNYDTLRSDLLRKSHSSRI